MPSKKPPYVLPPENPYTAQTDSRTERERNPQATEFRTYLAMGYLVCQPTAQYEDQPQHAGEDQHVHRIVERQVNTESGYQFHITTPEFHELLEAQGLSRARRHEMSVWLVQTRILTASIGGWTVDRTAL